jgi:uncharacterized damage-inducible protein DinB
MRVASAACLGVIIAMAATTAPLPAQQPTAPAGIRAELATDIIALQSKFVALAEAMPAERFGWRPAEGVRSVSEVMMHVADTNHYLAELVGAELPAGLGYAEEMGSLEAITEPARVLEALRGSFAHAQRAVAATPDADLERRVEVFGTETTVRAVLLMLVTHMHEHLGQSIAYARSIGVTPPWSAAGG